MSSPLCLISSTTAAANTETGLLNAAAGVHLVVFWMKVAWESGTFSSFEVGQFGFNDTSKIPVRLDTAVGGDIPLLSFKNPIYGGLNQRFEVIRSVSGNGVIRVALGYQLVKPEAIGLLV